MQIAARHMMSSADARQLFISNLLHAIDNAHYTEAHKDPFSRTYINLSQSFALTPVLQLRRL